MVFLNKISWICHCHSHCHCHCYWRGSCKILIQFLKDLVGSCKDLVKIFQVPAGILEVPARILEDPRGHWTLWICSSKLTNFPWAMLSENCSLLGANSVWTNIWEYFCTKWGLLFNMHNPPNICACSWWVLVHHLTVCAQAKT